MRTLKILTSEDEQLLNSLLKKKKTSSYVLLYHSEWDKASNAILEKAYAWAEKEGDEELFVISSWELPHAFAAFSIMSAPSIVEVKSGSVRVHVEYPRVYDYFSPSQKKGRRGPRSRGRKN